MNHLTKSITINLTELLILLALPLPFLHLNVLYVVLAIIIILTSKKLRKENWSDYGFKSVTIKGVVLSVIIGLHLEYSTIM